MRIMKKQNDEKAMRHILKNSQESLPPDIYEMFIAAYNKLIENRRLPIEKIEY